MSRRRTGRLSAALLVLVVAFATTAGVALAAFRDQSSVNVSATAASEFAPLVQLVPHFNGTSFGGNTLTAVTGTWTRTIANPTITYSWFRCTVTGGCGATPVGTGTTYVVPTTDDAPIGTPSSVYYAVRETAANTVRSASAVSVPGGRQTRGGVVGVYLNVPNTEVLSLRSTPTTMPAQSATARVGTSISVSTGTWTDTSSSLLGPVVDLLNTLLTIDGNATYARQWLRCGPVGNTGSPTVGAAGCSEISGATGTTYVPTAADVGQRLRVRVTRTSGAPVLSATLAGVLGIGATVNTRAVAVVFTQAGAVVSS